ncbi:peptidoglycan DD-metalloendopeptidase family protein [Herbiconiux sp. VKM Ac-1786]|uniref:peptidoglycan DD-metalloendopeptidase family protein n=1 Tax=Herbiconiux sp. VKM Ac-1786 TaxID=2783824 RepID=UPI001889FE8F|nr:M23 family metallopeptidase [Herbiconiux sp. VKM Ac-1786]MBF4571531.1 peptidoglycan DD-metalloendopeptidase family protein [Herbiconiux sp. VKM Ac-1786]
MSTANPTPPSARAAGDPASAVQPRMRAKRPVHTWVAAVVLALAIICVEVLRGVEPASAIDYPSWEDVLAARGSESAKQAEVERIQGIVAQLQTEVEAAQAFAAQKADEYSAAQDAYDTATFRADELDRQAAEATLRAEESNGQAGQLISQLSRAGGTDLTLNLIVSGDASDDLLYRLGAMSQLSQQTVRLYEQAAQDRNTAKSLTDQAVVARTELEGLKNAAEAALAEAQEAQAQLEGALAEQEAQSIVLDEQLKALQESTAKTVADYEAGVAERKRLEEEARERARQEAIRRAQEAAEAGGGGGGPIASVDGWTSPLASWRVSDEWGQRFHPIFHEWRLHAGIDLVAPGGTCGVPVYAAATGTVTQASYNGGLGNSVTINHGGGLTTVYGHNSSLNVGRGQDVGVGELIAWAGTTGSSTGCHVHFETRVGGVSQNPRNFVGF